MHKKINVNRKKKRNKKRKGTVILIHRGMNSVPRAEINPLIPRAVKLQPSGASDPLSLSAGSRNSSQGACPLPLPVSWLVLSSPGLSRGTPMGRLPSRLLWGWSLVDVQLLPLKDLPGASPLTQAMLLRPLMVGLAHFLLFYPPWSGRARRLPCSVLLRLCFVFLHGVWIQVGESLPF